MGNGRAAQAAFQPAVQPGPGAVSSLYGKTVTVYRRPARHIHVPYYGASPSEQPMAASGTPAASHAGPGTACNPHGQRVIVQRKPARHIRVDRFGAPIPQQFVANLAVSGTEPAAAAVADMSVTTALPFGREATGPKRRTAKKRKAAPVAQHPQVHRAADPHARTADASQTHVQHSPDSSCTYIGQQPTLMTDQQAAGITNAAGADDCEMPHHIPSSSQRSHEDLLRPIEKDQCASEKINDMVIDLTEATPDQPRPLSCAPDRQNSTVASPGLEVVQAVSLTDDVDHLPASAPVRQEDLPESLPGNLTSMQAAAEAASDVQETDAAHIPAGVNPAAPLSDVVQLQHEGSRLQQAPEKTEKCCQQASPQIAVKSQEIEQLRKRAAEQDDLAAQIKSRLQEDLRHSEVERQKLSADTQRQAHEILSLESSMNR